MNDSDDDPIDSKPARAPPSLPHKEETKQEPHKESSDHQKPLPTPQKPTNPNPATKTSDPPKEKPIPNPKPNADTQPSRPLPNPARKSTIAPTKPIPNPKPQNQESSENHNQPPPKEKPLPNPKPNHPPSEDHTKQAPRPQRIQSLLIEPKPTQMQTNTQPNAFYTDFSGGFPTFPDGDNSFSTSFSTSQDAQIQLPPLPGRTSSNFDFNPFEEGEPFHDPPRKLSSADYNNQTPMLPPSLPKKESSSIQNKIDDM
jgi:hypothetical protein